METVNPSPAAFNAVFMYSVFIFPITAMLFIRVISSDACPIAEIIIMHPPQRDMISDVCGLDFDKNSASNEVITAIAAREKTFIISQPKQRFYCVKKNFNLIYHHK